MKRTMMTEMGLLAGILLAASMGGQAQGPLAPSGAPEPTMKTLDQIEPRTAITNVPITINKAGSYYFTKNLVCAEAALAAIQVTANNVAIDMGGFVLEGPNEMGMKAILQESANGLIVENGSIRDFDGDAVQANGGGNIFRNLRVNGCFYGINCGYNSLVEYCVINAMSNPDGSCLGIYGGDDSVVQNCSVSHLRGTLLAVGIYVEGNAVVSKCTVEDVACSEGASAGGFYMAASGVASDCSASRCQGYGFYVFGGVVLNSIADNNHLGVRLFAGARAEQVKALNNTTNGFQVSDYCTVTRCTAYQNEVQGVNVAGNRNYIYENTCSVNGSSGIFVMEDDNRIENNHVIGNDYGIYLRYWAPDSLATRNIVMRNTVGRNTTLNYHVGVSNWVANIDTTGAFAGANDNFSF